MGRPHTGRADKSGSAGGNGEERIAARSAKAHRRSGTHCTNGLSELISSFDRLSRDTCANSSAPHVSDRGSSCPLGSRHLARPLACRRGERAVAGKEGEHRSLRDSCCVLPGCYRISHKCATSLASSCRGFERTANPNRRGAPEDLSMNLLLHSARCDESASSSQQETRTDRRCARCGSSKEWSYAPTSSMGRRTCVCTRREAHAVCACPCRQRNLARAHACFLPFLRRRARVLATSPVAMLLRNPPLRHIFCNAVMIAQHK